MNKLVKNILLVTCAVGVSSCSIVNYIIQKRESGKFWCNERYLPEDINHFNDQELTIARNGYIYSFLGAIALQDNSIDSKNHWFNLPDNIKEIYSDSKSSGFQGKTFLIFDKETKKPQKLVIAFAGTNEPKDWLANTQLSDEQFKQALNFYKESLQLDSVVRSGKLDKIVVTGYSLGGALATYVGKNPEVKNQISEVWLFNPSPLSKTDYKQEQNFWFGATRNDVLKKLRASTKGYMGLFEKNHIYDDQFLVRSNDIYAHSRWVVARNMLWTADFAYVKQDKNEKNPAYDLIQLSDFKACKKN